MAASIGPDQKVDKLEDIWKDLQYGVHASYPPNRHPIGKVPSAPNTGQAGFLDAIIQLRDRLGSRHICAIN
jgi:hypothetical protein